MDGQLKSRNDAYTYCKILADNPEFPWARLLNYQVPQAHPEKTWASIERFPQKCGSQVKGKKGFPQSKKHHVRASVDYKVSGWNQSEDRCYLEFTDCRKAGVFLMWGTRNLHFYQLNQIKRVRVIRRHDGY
jgi:putative transposase